MARRKGAAPVTVWKRHQTYYVRYSWKGQREQYPVSKVKRTANATALKIGAELEEKDHDPTAWKRAYRQPGAVTSKGKRTFKQVAVEWEKKGLDPEVSIASRTFYGFMVNALLREPWADKPLDRIGTGIVDDYLNQKMEQVRERALSQNHYVNTGRVLKRVFAYAVEQGYVATSPVKHNFRTPPGERMFVASRDEEQALLAAAPETLPLLLLAAFETGGRRAELVRLRWQDVNFKARTVTFTRTKSKKPRTVPLTPKLDKALRPLRGIGHVFADDDGNALKLRRVSQQVTDLSRRLNLLRTVTEKDGEETTYYFRLHDARHTYASRLANSGLPLNQVQKVLGHADITTTMRYVHGEVDNAAVIAALARAE